MWVNEFFKILGEALEQAGALIVSLFKTLSQFLWDEKGPTFYGGLILVVFVVGLTLFGITFVINIIGGHDDD